MRRPKVRSIILLLILVGCIDAFSPEINGKAEEIVIDGMITDQAAVQTVYVSRTKSITDISSYPTGISGAAVTITDDQGNIFPLTETGVGTYETVGDVQGVAGRSYQVNVSIDGKAYQSEPETLPSSNPVVSLTAAFKNSFQHAGSSEILSNVVVFYLDVANNPGTTDYYKYDWDATYKLISPFKDSPDSCATFTGTTVPPFCYTNEKAETFLNILSLEQFTGATYQQHVLAAIDPNIRFISRYSMNVKQHGISKRAYLYWNSIKALSFGTGSLFDPPPAKVIGNIRSLSNAKENVLGYFMAASVEQKRGFFSSDMITASFQNLLDCDCLPWRNDCEPPIPDWMKPPPPPKRIYCCDCSSYPNTSPNKPSFWID